MKEEIDILRSRLREHLKEWLNSTGGDSLGTVAEFFDLTIALQPSKQDSLIVRERKRALRDLVSEINKHTPVVPIWHDIIRKLNADTLQACAPLPATTPSGQSHEETQPSSLDRKTTPPGNSRVARYCFHYEFYPVGQG